MGFIETQSTNHLNELNAYCQKYGFSECSLSRDIVFNELYACWAERIKQKKYNFDAYVFERNLGPELLRRAIDIEQLSWRPEGYKEFKVFNPERVISAPLYPDRIVEAWLTDRYVIPYWKDKVLANNMACQKDKGPHKLVANLKDDLEECYKKYGKDFWFFQFDIQGYYDNISHDYCKRIFAGMDPVGYFLLSNIIDSWEETECYAKQRFPDKRFGVPKGTLTSQWIGITVLNELDYLLHDNFNAEVCYRYMDDGILIFQNKELCKKALRECEKYLLENELGIQLHPKKTVYAPISRGFNFCGWHFRLRDDGSVELKVRNDRKKLKKQELKSKQKAYKSDFITWGEISSSLQSTFAHYGHGDASKLIKYMTYRYKFQKDTQ